MKVSNEGMTFKLEKVKENSKIYSIYDPNKRRKKIQKKC